MRASGFPYAVVRCTGEGARGAGGWFDRRVNERDDPMLHTTHVHTTLNTVTQ